MYLFFFFLNEIFSTRFYLIKMFFFYYYLLNKQIQTRYIFIYVNDFLVFKF